LSPPEYFPRSDLIDLLESRLRPPRYDADVLIVTVKKPELDAVLSAFDLPSSDMGFPIPGGARFWRAKLPRARSATPLSLLITVVGEAQNYKMSSFMHTVLSHCRPRLAVLVGMAAGQKRKVNLGNVVVASEVVDYANAVLTEEEVIPDPQNFLVEQTLTRPIYLFDRIREAWYADLHARLDEAVRQLAETGITLPAAVRNRPASFLPRLDLGVILAGDLLMEDESLQFRADQLKRRRALAAEMEGAGFACICREAHLSWMVFRGVADFGGPNRRKDWQFVAALAAATALRLLLSSLLLDLGTIEQPS